MSERIEHTLEPFVFKEARVLILGSLPSPKSREVGFYYGHPMNRFWKVLSYIFGDKADTIEERKALLLKNRIALFDVIKSCEITGASDSSIRNPIPNDIDGLIRGTKIGEVFTTGRTAHDLLKKLTGRESVCLPSPSPANCAVKFDELVEAYTKIKHAIEGSCC